MTHQQTEIAVVGGGMVGGALALGLAQQGFEVTVIEQAAPVAFDPTAKPDVRISAISAASVDLLRGLGVWDAVLGMRAHPYSRLETWEWENAHVAFDAAELKLPRLGYMVENTVLQLALWQALEAHPKVALRVRRHLKHCIPTKAGICLSWIRVMSWPRSWLSERMVPTHRSGKWRELVFMPGSTSRRAC